MKTRLDALALLHEYVKSESLRKHCLSVAYAMEAYAEKYGEDTDKWWITGLLHDFDWEIHPDLNRHPMEGAKILRVRGVDEDIIRTILSHYEEGSGVLRTQPIDFIETIESLASTTQNEILLGFDEKSPDPQYLLFRITLTGSESNLLKYFSLIELLPYEIRVDDINFQRGAGEHTEKSATDQLILSIRVRADKP